MPRWDAEPIPDDARLFLRVHYAYVRNGLNPNIFIEKGGGMSTDWEEYASPADTRGRGRKPASEYGVVALVTGAVRAVPGLSVKHTPEDDNQAHTDVSGFGAGRLERNNRRLQLFERFDKVWLIEPEPL